MTNRDVILIRPFNRLTRLEPSDHKHRPYTHIVLSFVLVMRRPHTRRTYYYRGRRGLKVPRTRDHHRLLRLICTTVN